MYQLEIRDYSISELVRFRESEQEAISVSVGSTFTTSCWAHYTFW